ncbi:MAG TPA: TerC family protein [Gammaproteobacteria bacterium]|jgi:predicted tellurium resistance membrane protein TerC|nr:TerC family protein [Gammaproteobacteria bacterium]
MEWLSSPEAWIALFTLTALEIVLGVDNIIFISILVGRLPQAQRQRARILGLAFAMGTRILLLLLLTWIMRLQSTLFTAFGIDISGRDLILIGGGLFLIAKSTLEIHSSLEGAQSEEHEVRHAGFVSVIFQIGIIDIVFSLDSVITAVGLANDVIVMIVAIVIAVIVMMFSAGAIGRFVDDHPTIKMLALSFLVLIGVALIAEGADVHLPKSYIYFAMAFSVVVEMLNLRIRRGRSPLQLKKKEP